jgi:hypothetical protein
MSSKSQVVFEKASDFSFLEKWRLYHFSKNVFKKHKNYSKCLTSLKKASISLKMS